MSVQQAVATYVNSDQFAAQKGILSAQAFAHLAQKKSAEIPIIIAVTKKIIAI
jgi:hypothetical protein